MVTVTSQAARSRALKKGEVTESLVDRRFGRFAGFQYNTRPGEKPSTDLEVRNSAGQIQSFVKGAALGGTEFDLLCWSCAQAVDTRESRKGEVRTTLTQLARALYGYDRKMSTSDRRRVRDALDSLWKAEIGLRIYDPDGPGDGLADWTAKGRFLQEFQYGRELAALEEGVDIPPEVIGSLRDETLVFRLADWLVERLEDEEWRHLLDWPIQRSMGSGMGKRLWVFLETERCYEPLAPGSQYEHLEVELTDDVYIELGANCNRLADNRKAVKRGLERVLEMDTRYVGESKGTEFGSKLIPARGLRPDVLRIVRLRRDQEAPQGLSRQLELSA